MKETNEKFKTKIGGQALLEGIMMLGPDKSAVVVRTKEGLKTQVEPRKVQQGFSVRKIPFIRGVFNFCTSMRIGVKALMYSADLYAQDEDEPQGQQQSKFDAWLERKLSSEKAQSVTITIAVVIGILFSVGLFILLPSLIGTVINRYITDNELVRNLLEGLVRIVIFLTYMFLISRVKDMKRVFSYHGAEHKTIRCYEARLPLTVENVKQQTRLHPRCGTSFLFVVVMISILVFSVASILLKPITPEFSSTILNALVRMALRLLLLPIVVGISYEISQAVGRHDNAFTRALAAPGMWLQYLTTNEPDDGMMEVAIEALTLVLPEKEGDDRW